MNLHEKDIARLCDKELAKHMRDKTSYNLVESTHYVCQSCNKKVKKITKEYGKMPIAFWILQEGMNQYINDNAFLSVSPEKCSCGGILKSSCICLQDKHSNKVFRALRPEISLSIAHNDDDDTPSIPEYMSFLNSTDFNNNVFAEKCLPFINIILKTIKKQKIVEAFSKINPDLFKSLKDSSIDELSSVFESFTQDEKISILINLNKMFFNNNLYKMTPRNILEMLYNEKDYKANVKELYGDFRYVLFFETLICPTSFSADYSLVIALIMNKIQNILDVTDFAYLLSKKPELFKLCDTAYSAEYYYSACNNMLFHIRQTEYELALLQEENANLKSKLKEEQKREVVTETRSKDDINKIKELKSIINSLKDELNSLKELQK